MKIKSFGLIIANKYKFRKCPLNTIKERKYEVEGDNENIISKKSGSNYSYSGALVENELEKGKINQWKIKILKTKSYDIKIGIASIDFDNNNPLPNKGKSCGWYYSCDNANLNSGPPENINGKKTNLNKKKDEIFIIMDMTNGTLKFIIDNEDKGISFSNIPTDKPLFPSILIMNIEDSIEITES